MIQGSSSDMVKIALVEFRRWLNLKSLRDKVQPFVQLHDEIAISCHTSMKEVVLAKVTEVMETAATLVLNNTLLKVDAEINGTW